MRRDGRRLLLAAAVVVAAGCSGPAESEAAPPPPRQVATAEALLGPWRPVPLQLDAGTAAGADRACRRAAGAGGFGELVAGNFRLAIADARGEGRLWLGYSGPGGLFADCQVMLGQDNGLEVIGLGSGGGDPIAEPFGLVIQSSVSFGAGPDGQREWSGALGAVGPGIAGVRVRLPDGLAVDASLGNGAYAAWWPGPQGSILVQAFDAAGTKVAEVQQ